jgi:threonine/homoserine/homoserine lactone efflux protein
VATGITTILLSVPRLAPVLMAVSVAYIVVLAVRIARAPPLSRHNSAVAAPSFAGGHLLAVTNPKAYVAIAAVLGGATSIKPSPVTEALLKAAILGLMIVIIHVAWLLVGASLSRVLSDPVASRIANLAFAGILIPTSVIAALH